MRPMNYEWTMTFESIDGSDVRTISGRSSTLALAEKARQGKVSMMKNRHSEDWTVTGSSVIDLSAI